MLGIKIMAKFGGKTHYAKLKDRLGGTRKDKMHEKKEI